MIVVVADTSGLLAALSAEHPAGDGARRVLNDAGTLVLSPLLLSELDHVGRRVLGRRETAEALDDIVTWVRRGRAVLPTIDADTLQQAQAVRQRYLGLDLDLVDVVNVVLAAQFDTDCVLTLDERDFRAVRPLSAHAAFRVLPFDSA